MTALPHGLPVAFRAPPPPTCDFCRRRLEPKASCQGCGAPTGYREPPPMQELHIADGAPANAEQIRAWQDACDSVAGLTRGRRRLSLPPLIMWYTGP